MKRASKDPRPVGRQHRIARAPVDDDESDLKYEPVVVLPKSHVADIERDIAWDFVLVCE